MAGARITRDQLDVGYTPDSTVRVTRMVIEVLQYNTQVPSSGAKTVVVVAQG